MTPRWSSADLHQGDPLGRLKPFTVQCVCSWTGNLDQMTERVERGSSVLSYYGPSPDWCYLGCPECGAEDDFEQGKFFKARRKRINARLLHHSHRKDAA